MSGSVLPNYGTSLEAQTIKCLSTMWETWVRSLGREDPLEKEMAAHSSILAWRIPGTEEPGGLPSRGVAQSRTRLKRLSSSSSRGKHRQNTL